MGSTIKQRLRRYNGTDYDTIHLETETSALTDWPSGGTDGQVLGLASSSLAWITAGGGGMSVKQYTRKGTSYIYCTNVSDATHYRLTCPDEWDVCILAVRISKLSNDSQSPTFWVEDLMITPNNTSPVPFTGFMAYSGGTGTTAIPTSTAVGYRAGVMYESSTNKIKIYNMINFGSTDIYIILNSISAVWL